MSRRRKSGIASRPAAADRVPAGWRGRFPILILLAAPAAALAVPARVPADTAFPAFVPRYFQDTVSEPPTLRETLSPVDLDGDGDLDFFTGHGRGGPELWFENGGGGNWTRHLVSDSNDADVGAAVADVDGDGDWDRIAGGFVYLNPGPGRPGPFVPVRTGAFDYTHDLLAGDIDKDGRPDFVTLDKLGLSLYRNPGPPYKDWAVTLISDSTTGLHGGLALGDFDRDGDLDVSRVNCWFENRDGGRTWVPRFGPDFGQPAERFWGLSARVVVEDIDGDGDLDLAQAECDVDNGRVAWFENRYYGDVWIPHLVKDSVDGQDFHSLVLADFDGDGDKDFFSCGSSLSRGAKQWYVWENLDGQGWEFREHVIWKDAARGGHESVAFDVDGDGDPDILSKEFTGYHTWLENLGVPGGPGKVAGSARPAWRLETRAWWSGRGKVGFLPPGALSRPRDGLGRSFRIR